MALENNPSISEHVKKIALTIFLFFSFTLHAMVFGFAQHPESFLSKELDLYPVILKTIFYVFAIGVSFLHQPIAKWMGLKKTLICGLWFNVLGLSFLLIHHYWKAPISDVLLFPAVIVLGSSLLSVLNCLITFIVLEHPKKTVIAVTALFLFGNLGVMIAPILLRIMHKIGLETEIFFLIIIFLLVFMFLTQLIFVEPPYPKHLNHLRSGTLVWREMHRRLILFMIALVFYSLTESTFNSWGSVYALQYMDVHTMENVITVFWLSMILGQLIALIPLYYFDAFKVFYYLAGVAAIGLILLPTHTDLSMIVLAMIVGGAGCAALFPIILASLEIEVIYMSLVSGHVSYLPLIETAISFMTGMYILGIAIMDFSVLLIKNPDPALHFYIAPLFLLIMSSVMFYLNKTKGQKMGSTHSFFHKK